MVADGTAIEWTDITWNPIRARNLATGGIGHFCVHVSGGCRHCYAERMQPRFRNPVRYAAQDAGQVSLFLDRRALVMPLRWRRPRTVFVCSMTDLFREGHPDAFIDLVFATMALVPRHTFQVLTKRHLGMEDYLTGKLSGNDRTRGWAQAAVEHTGDDPRAAAVGDAELPLRNVWVGVSAEDQRTADERLPALLRTPAACRFVSAEPLLVPINLAGWLSGRECHPPHWVIVGGESGPQARSMHSEWARSIRDQCSAAGIPFFSSNGASTRGTGGGPEDGKQDGGWTEWSGTGCRCNTRGEASGEVPPPKPQRAPAAPPEPVAERSGDTIRWPNREAQPGHR